MESNIMPKMSEQCKEQMINEFGFKNSELLQIENFMNGQNGKTAKEILYAVIKDKKLDSKQKIIISYVVGTSAEAAREKEKDIVIDSNMPIYAG